MQIKRWGKAKKERKKETRKKKLDSILYGEQTDPSNILAAELNLRSPERAMRASSNVLGSAWMPSAWWCEDKDRSFFAQELQPLKLGAPGGRLGLSFKVTYRKSTPNSSI